MSRRDQSKAPTSTEVIEGVPSTDVSRVTQDFRDSGAIVVSTEPNADGTWTVTTVFPSD
jgi:hypothetical protein